MSDHCEHDPLLDAGSCRNCAIVVEEYYRAMKRRTIHSAATSANVLIAHYQECVRWSKNRDVELGIVDDLPAVPIIKIENLLGEKDVSSTPNKSGTRPKDDSAMPTTSDTCPILPSQVVAGDGRNWIRELRELPVSFTLGAIVMLFIAVVILAGVVASLYSRAGELMLTLYILRGGLRWLRRRFSQQE